MAFEKTFSTKIISNGGELTNKEIYKKIFCAIFNEKNEMVKKKSFDSDGNSYIAKTVVCGSSGVGKTSLFDRFFEDQFNYNQRACTIGVDFRIKSQEKGQDCMKVKINKKQNKY